MALVLGTEPVASFRDPRSTEGKVGGGRQAGAVPGCVAFTWKAGGRRLEGSPPREAGLVTQLRNTLS